MTNQNKHNKSKGLLIAFEGIDGCGKSTQVKLLFEKLRNKTDSIPYRLVREPGSTPTAESVRKILLQKKDSAVNPEAELFLYLAARADLYSQEILPALDRGETVISDRCFWSTVAYQGAGLNLGIEKARELSLIATKGREPDIVLVFDLDPETAQQRRTGTADRIEARSLEYQAHVRTTFLKLAGSSQEKAFILNGSETVEKIHKEVVEHVEQLFAENKTSEKFKNI